MFNFEYLHCISGDEYNLLKSFGRMANEVSVTTYICATNLDLFQSTF